MSRSVSVLLALTHALAACGQVPEGGGTAEATAGDIAALRNQPSVFDAAAGAEDIDAMMSLFADDAVRMPPNAPAAIGSAAIRDLFLQDWQANDFEGRNELVDLRIAGDLAVGYGTWEGRVIPEDGSPAFDDVGKWMASWERQTDGSWKVLWNVFNSDLPPTMP